MNRTFIHATVPSELLLFYCLQGNQDATTYLLESFYCVFERESVDEVIESVFLLLDHHGEREAMYHLSTVIEGMDDEVSSGTTVYTQQDLVHLLLDEGIPYQMENGVLYLGEEAEHFLVDNEIYI